MATRREPTVKSHTLFFLGILLISLIQIRTIEKRSNLLLTLDLNPSGEKKLASDINDNWPNAVQPDNKIGKLKYDYTELRIDIDEQLDNSTKTMHLWTWLGSFSICIIIVVHIILLQWNSAKFFMNLPMISLEPQPALLSTPLGTIQGVYKTSTGGRKFEAYMGILYALPPTGERRFEVPEPVSPWKDTLMATSLKSSCLQYGPKPLMQYIMFRNSDSEDCLYLNVYTPNREERGKQLLPVIFFIHGGAFRSGSARSYGAQYLLDRDVVLVTINYRLGPLGFMSTEDDVVPGNMGLKDQVVALRWVQDNIRSFGGDPKRVTMVGHSAGGVSVHLHYLTNVTKGLFHRGISLSGTALQSWGQAESSLMKARNISAQVGCSNDTIRKMVNCMKTKPATRIVAASSAFSPWFFNPFSPFGPVVEKGGASFTYLDRSPIDIINAGDFQDLPWITGVVSHEGLFPAALFMENDTRLGDLNDNWDEQLPHLLDYNFTIPESQQHIVNRMIQERYLGREPISNYTIMPVVQMISDRLYNYNAAIAARLQAAKTKSPVRFYYFSFRGEYSFSNWFIRSKNNYGVSHGDDLAYVLLSFFDATTTANDRKVQKILLDLWVSFAVDGKPNMGVDWPELDPFARTLRYLHIAGPNQLRTEKKINFGQQKFWLRLGFNENILSKSRKMNNRGELEKSWDPRPIDDQYTTFYYV